MSVIIAILSKYAGDTPGKAGYATGAVGISLLPCEVMYTSQIDEEPCSQVFWVPFGPQTTASAMK